jgi:hypothetical protein
VAGAEVALTAAETSAGLYLSSALFQALPASTQASQLASIKAADNAAYNAVELAKANEGNAATLQAAFSAIEVLAGVIPQSATSGTPS